MDVTIENDSLKVGIKKKGAELASVFNKETTLEYMWGADPAFWGKSSPVLFPIVGTLKEDIYKFDDKTYSLPRHGFARDYIFDIEHKQAGRVVFLLKSTPETLAKYPFSFELRLSYELSASSLLVTYQVSNTGDKTQYFSIGGHPAFKVPLTSNARYEDYFLEFEKRETTGRWPLAAGLVKTTSVPLLDNTNVLPLTRSLFSEDTIVLKDLKSKKVTLRSRNDHHGVEFTFDGFPFLGIWAAPNADFVCIEPWCGIADSVTHNQQFISKEGIEHVQAGQMWSRTWWVKFK